VGDALRLEVERLDAQPFRFAGHRPILLDARCYTRRARRERRSRDAAEGADPRVERSGNRDWQTLARKRPCWREARRERVHRRGKQRRSRRCQSLR
jgi:hypothetical protein